MEVLKKFRVALVQHSQTMVKSEILAIVESQIDLAVQNDVKFVLLPECFNTLYRSDLLKSNAEEFSLADISKSPTLIFVSKMAQKHGVYIIGKNLYIILLFLT